MDKDSITFLNRKEFKNLYGERIYAITNNLERLFKKKTKLEQQVKFLQQCKQHNLIPKGLSLKNTTKSTKNEKLLKTTMYKILNNTLEERQKQLRYIRIEIKTQTPILHQYLQANQSLRNVDEDLAWINKYEGEFKKNLIKKHNHKLERLKYQQGPNQTTTNTNSTGAEPQIKSNSTNVINMSKVSLSQDHLKVLAKGLKFIPTPKNINIITNIANCESALFSTPSNIKKAAVAEVVTFIQKWKKPKQHNMTKHENQLLKEIKSMEQIVVVPADKGGKIVVLDKVEYITKMEEKLNDKNTYEQIKSDPTKNLKKEINRTATKLFEQGKISQAKKFHLTRIDDLPSARGQPKLHKNGAPMRIITCSRGTIFSPISRFVFNLIKDLRQSLDGVVRDTTSFVREITNTHLDQEEKLASLDIQDLFSNIPLTKAVDITIEKLVETKKLDSLTLTKTDVKNLLLLSLSNIYLQFNGKFYRQCNGLPMGNTLSPIIADIYMDFYMKQHLTRVNQPRKIWRYVDDVLILTKMNKQQLEEYVNSLNSIRGKIRFTFEFEQHKTINFLDTTLHRQPTDNTNTIRVRWLRKETASDRLLNYESSHGRSIKENLVKNMTNRILETSKDPKEQEDDLRKLKDMLTNSNYPPKEIEKLMKQACRAFNSSSQNTTDVTEPKTKFNLTLNYVPGIEVLKRKLEKLQIKLYFSYPNKLQSNFNRSMKTTSRSVVYQVMCDCNPPKIYNGETKVGLDSRMKQHFKLINDLDERSEMVQHIKENKYQCLFHIEEAITVEQEKDWKKRRIKETIYSQLNESINRRDDLCEAWGPILYQAKQQITRRTVRCKKN